MKAANGIGRSLAALVLIGVAALGAGFAVLVPQLGAKGLIAVAGAMAVVAAIAVLGRAREILLAAYILALSYNRQYFSFDDILGASGSQGFYWSVSDPLLLLLLATSFFTPRGNSQTVMANGAVGAALLPILPFLAACCLSSLVAMRPDWAFYDTIRVVKFTVLMAWLHRYMTPSLWKTAVATFAAVVVLQSSLGIVQVLLKSEASLLAVAGLAKEVKNIATEIDNRARGTMGHPNILAPWLIMIVPAAMGVALFARHRWLALAGYAITLLGFAGVFASKSRAPVVILAAALLGVAVLAVRLRALSPRAAIGCFIVLLALGVAITVPILAGVTERIVGDFNQSVQFRADYNRAALAIWNDYPLLGIGPNNVNIELGRHAPWLERVIRDADQYRDLGNARAPTVHNVYFLILSETGLLGLAGFLLLAGALLLRGARAASLTSGAMRGFCIGMTFGLVASYVQQTVDFSLWYDTSWYSLAVIAALIGTAPAVEAAERSQSETKTRQSRPSNRDDRLGHPQEPLTI